MDNLLTKKYIFFLGIGGIGMSALARYFHGLGHVVAGYDRTENRICRGLAELNIPIQYQDDSALLPKWMMEQPAEQILIIYTPAVPSSAALFQFFAQGDWTFIKRAVALAEISQQHPTIAVAGTHGKTSTSAYIAQLLYGEKRSFKAFVGGVVANFQKNYIEYQGQEAPIVVLEADEFDHSFLLLKPEVAVVTSCEADHLDIYGSFDKLKEAYTAFINQLRPDGTLIIHQSLEGSFSIRKDINVFYYGNSSEIAVQNLSVENGQATFDIPYFGLTNIENGLPGEHNRLNTLAALKAASLYSELKEVKKSLKNFRGIYRRFEILVKSPNGIYIDDYAHHPTEIQAALSTARELFPDKKITILFQPHLFTRTRDLALDFKQVLARADHLMLLPIYPARELPIEGVDAGILTDNQARDLLTFEEVIPTINRCKPEVLLSLGAGSIELLREPIIHHFNTLVHAGE